MAEPDDSTTATWPIDRLVDDPIHAHDRIVEVAAPPDEVWPWLAQMGYGRAGWYSFDAVERLVGVARSVDGWRSLDRLEPRLATIATGDRLPLGPGQSFDVVAADPPCLLSLAWSGRCGSGQVTFGWEWRLAAVGRGTRMHVATRVGATDGVAAAVVAGALGPGHRVMEWAQVRGLRRRVSGD